MSRYGKLLTVHEASDYTGLTVEQLYRLSAEGRIACVRTDGRELTRRQNGKVVKYTKSGRLRFCERDLDDWIDAHRTPARTAIQPPQRVTKPLQTSLVSVSIAQFMPKHRRFAG